MAKYRKINKDKLIDLATKYCDECIDNVRTTFSKNGNIIEIRDRHLPTLEYWLQHWLRRKNKDFYDQFLKRSQVYLAIRDENHPLHKCLNEVRQLFDSVAVDIVANEGKGIFYAKNRLGMSDKQELKQDILDKSKLPEWLRDEL